MIVRYWVGWLRETLDKLRVAVTMTFFFRLIYRNLLRHPLRSGLTALSIVIAILAFGILRTMVDAWYAGVEATSANRLVTRNAVSLTFRLPLAYQDRIQRVDGVTGVSHMTWFGGVYINEKNLFPQFAVEPQSYLELHPELILSPDEKFAFLHHRNGAVAGRKLASRYGWKVGDVIPLRGTSYPGDWSFVLQGIYRGAKSNTDEKTFLFHWKILNEYLRKTQPIRADQVGGFIVGIGNADRSAEVSHAIDEMFENSMAETLTETEEAFSLGFVSMSQSIVVATQIVSFVVIAIIIIVATNTIAMSARERTREYATLGALGFGPGHIALLLIGESVTLSLSAGIASVLLIFPVADMVRLQLDTVFSVFAVTEQTLWMAMGAALVVGIIASLVPMWHVLRVPIARGLGGVENA